MDGALWCWGENLEGQLGDGSQMRLYVPTQIPVVGVIDLQGGTGHLVHAPRRRLRRCGGNTPVASSETAR